MVEVPTTTSTRIARLMDMLTNALLRKALLLTPVLIVAAWALRQIVRSLTRGQGTTAAATKGEVSCSREDLIAFVVETERELEEMVVRPDLDDLTREAALDELFDRLAQNPSADEPGEGVVIEQVAVATLNRILDAETPFDELKRIETQGAKPATGVCEMIRARMEEHSPDIL